MKTAQVSVNFVTVNATKFAQAVTETVVVVHKTRVRLIKVRRYPVVIYIFV